MNYCRFRNDVIKRMANAGGGGLPSIYQAVEYLQGNGSQYIDMGFPTDTANKIDFDIDCTLSYNTSETYGNAVFGAFANNPTRQSGTLYLRKNQHAEFYYCGGLVVTSLQPIDDSRYVTSINIDGTSVTYSSTDYSSAVTYNYTATASGNKTQGNLVLYAQRNLATNAVNGYSKIKVYGFNATLDNVLTREFIPCYRKADNKPGMYDLVTKTFFTNAGTGEFTVGNNV